MATCDKLQTQSQEEHRDVCHAENRRRKATKPKTGSLERSKNLINFQQEKQREKERRYKTPISERETRHHYRPCGHPKNKGTVPKALRA